MRTWLLLIAFCLCLSSRSLALDLDKSAQGAYTRVRNAPHFAVGGVGIAGTPSEEEKALRLLLQHKQAAAALEALLKDSGTSMEGQLYALLGLKLLELRSLSWAPSGKDKSDSKLDTKQEEESAGAKAFGQKVLSYFSSYRSRNTQAAAVMRGCLVVQRQVSAIADEIEQGIIALSPQPPPSPEPGQKVFVIFSTEPT